MPDISTDLRTLPGTLSYAGRSFLIILARAMPCEMTGRSTAAARSASADRQPGSLGGGRHLLPQPRRAHGGIEERGRRRFLRSRLSLRRVPNFSSKRRRTAWSGRAAKVAIRNDASWSVPEPELALFITPERKDRRLHHRQRHEFARYRGRESALSSAGQSLRPQLRAGALPSAFRTSRCPQPPKSQSKFAGAAKPHSPARPHSKK